MDELFSKKLEQKQKAFKNAANETNDQFADRYKNVSTTIQNNFKDMRGYVDNNVFSGELEAKEQEKNLDYSHDYVFLDVKRGVHAANKSVYDNIRKYGKAEPTEEDKKKKLSISGFFKKFANQFVEEFNGKEKNYQTALYDVAKTQNEKADKTTALELSRFLKYHDKLYDYLDTTNKSGIIAKGSLISQAADKYFAGAKKSFRTEKQKEFFTTFRYDVAPFLKTYKTKWFFGTRYYNIDGKRIKTKAGELNPEDYNKALMEGLILETRKDATLPNGKKIDAETLKKNRKQKAAVLTRITKELIEYGDKFDPKKMTDLYISNHIIELQEYYARLNAFQQLVIDNQWFFLGKEKVNTIKGKPYQDIQDAADPSFANLIKTHILDMRAPVSNFLEAHLRAHCLQSNYKFKERKHYFRNNEKQPFVVIGEDVEEIDDVKLDKSVDMDAISLDLTDVRERGNINGGATGQILTNKLNKIRYEQTRMLSKDLTNVIKTDLDKLKEDAKKDIENFNKLETNEKRKYPELPYAFATKNIGRIQDTVLTDLQYVQERMHSEKGTIMYMNFGPEIDHIYGKMYAAARLQAELSARQKVLDNKFKLSTIHNLEKDLKANKGTKLTRKSWQEQIDKIRKDNLKAVKVKSKNSYIAFSEDYLAQERINRAEGEYNEILKKMEYTQSEINICKKTIRFFINNPTEKRMEKNTDYDIIRKFLDKENLGYMFEVDKIEGLDEILDLALEDTERDLQKEAGKDAVAQPVKKADRSYRGKAARIAQVRQKGRRVVDTQHALIAGRTRFTSADQEFMKLVQMKPEDLKQFNYKGIIPVGTKEQKNAASDAMKLLGYIVRKEGNFNPNIYNNRVQMVMLYQNYKKAKIIPETLGYANFAADIRTKISMLSKWNNYVVETFKLQGDKEYTYLDTGALDGMSIHSLELLKANLVKREAQYKKEAEDIRKTINKKVNIPEQKITDNDGNVLNLIDSQEREEADAEVSIAYKLRKDKWVNCRTLLRVVEKRINLEKSKENFTEFSSEAYYNQMNSITLESTIEFSKYFTFPAATETSVRLAELAQTEDIKKLEENRVIKSISAKLDKDPNYLKNEKNLENEALGLISRLREIKIGPELVETAKNVLTDEHAPNILLLKDLLKYADTIGAMGEIVETAPEYANPAVLALKKYFERPENKELMDELVNKNEILSPLWWAINIYLEANNIVGAERFQVNGYWENFRNGVEDDKTLNEQQKKEKLDAESDKICTESGNKMWKYREKIRELEEKINKAGEFVNEAPSERLFRMVFEGGQELSLSKADDWKKIFETIKSKGYYKVKPNAKEGKTVWMKVAADQILRYWPQTFEDFCFAHAKLSTGKALDETFKNLAIKNGSAFVESTEHAAEISEHISKKQAFAYNALSIDKRKELDEALLHSGYNPQVFKYLFKDVEVNGAGLPVNKEAEDNRTENLVVAEYFIHRNDEVQPIYSRKEGWINTVVNEFRQAVSFEIKSEMTDPEYIKKHFKFLYDKSRKFMALKEVYEHEKGILDDPQVIKDKHLNLNLITKIHNAFGPKTRSVYAMYFELLEAYAHTYFVDKEGHFDMGLKPEDLYTKEGNAINKQDNQRKLLRVLEKRQDQLKRMTIRVNSELDRKVLSEKVANSDLIGKTLNYIKIKSDDNLIKLVHNKSFDGKLSDINILFQNEEIAETVDKYNKLIEKVKEIEMKEIEPGENKARILFASGKGKTKEYGDLVEETSKKNEKLLSADKADICALEFDIKQFQKNNMEVYKGYSECHNKDGSLRLFYDENGTIVNKVGKYLEYQSIIIEDVKRIYHDWKQFFTNPKNISKKTFNAETIVDKFKMNEMTVQMRELRKIDLYLNLLEVDRQKFKCEVKGKKYDVMKEIDNYIGTMRKSLKTMKNEKMINDVNKQIEKMISVKNFIEEVKKDMDSKDDRNPIQMIHDYVRLIFFTLKSYGVNDTGEIVEDQIRERVEGQLDEKKIKEIAYDEADKIGDAHIQLQHEINTRLGFEEKTEPVRKNSKSDKKKK